MWCLDKGQGKEGQGGRCAAYRGLWGSCQGGKGLAAAVGAGIRRISKRVGARSLFLSMVIHGDLSHTSTVQ